MKKPNPLAKFATYELVEECRKRNETPYYHELAARLAWLSERAPLTLWRGAKADGTPAFEILAADPDGFPKQEPGADCIQVLGAGTDLASAIADARRRENQQEERE